MVMMQKEVMPYVRFEIREWGRNEEASKKAGRVVPAIEEFICITSHGSKDSADHLVREFLPRKRREAEQGLFNPEWCDYFERAYKSWKDHNEVPRDGTPVISWQLVKPEQSHRLRALGITTVEDLAATPDSGLDQIGLDGRYLRDLARDWIREGEQKGINVQELANAQQKIRDQELTIQQLLRDVAALKAAQSEEAPRRGRRPKADTLEDDEAA